MNACSASFDRQKVKMNRCSNCSICCEGVLCKVCSVRRGCSYCHRRLDSICFDNDRVDICSVSQAGPRFINRELPRLVVNTLTRNVAPQMQAAYDDNHCATLWDHRSQYSCICMSLVSQTIMFTVVCCRRV